MLNYTHNFRNSQFPKKSISEKVNFRKKSIFDFSISEKVNFRFFVFRFFKLFFGNWNWKFNLNSKLTNCTKLFTCYLIFHLNWCFLLESRIIWKKMIILPDLLGAKHGENLGRRIVLPQVYCGSQVQVVWKWKSLVENHRVILHIQTEFSKNYIQ